MRFMQSNQGRDMLRSARSARLKAWAIGESKSCPSRLGARFVRRTADSTMGERPMDTISPQTSSEISEWVSAAALRLEAKVVAWRRDIHQNPELSYHETRTAALVAKHLGGLGYDVTTGVGETGVVGLLKGGKPGPVVALRADMDALPVEERVDVPFASKAKALWHGQMTGCILPSCTPAPHTTPLSGAHILPHVHAAHP